MPFDTFSRNSDSPSSPARHCFAIVPADAAELGSVTKAVYVGTAGDIVLRAVESDTDVTFRNVSAGAIIDVRCSAIRATGTTAGDIVGLA
ncbi:MAG: hypothetical protein ABJM58_03315 [Alteripontixanthobacter sp.]